ncbi:restriction endonuclease subunit S [Vibrio pacinii]|uniref:restriction endonuclease subunit S n=1 Tax=Vibrio pacinii TaxID=170674 RepID=UPI00056F2E4E|nr:restriction endonuclease subunit S [Vibrio pacinii]
MTVDKNVPDIRFKGFSGEWGRSPLGSLCLIGDIDHRMPESKITGIPYLMTGDFYGINGLDLNNAKLISIEDYEQLSKKIKPEFGDILFARYASVGAVRYVETDIKFLISYSCAILKTNNTTYGKYLFYFFQTEKTQGQFELGINTGSQRNIGIDSLKSLLVTLPKPVEQTQVGNYFQKLDSLINQQQQKHEKLSNLKRAMLEKMFPKQGETIPEIRFKGFIGEWIESPLNKIAMDITDGNWIEAEHIFDSGEYRIIQTGNIGVGQYLDRPKHAKYFQQSNFDTVRGNEIFPGDILISRLADPAGRAVILPDTGYRMVTAVDVAIVRPEPCFNSYFLMILLNRKEALKSVGEWVSGTSHKRISHANLVKIRFVVPCVKEQSLIGNYFQKLDTLIEQHQQQITKLTNIKQACLNKMFV